MSAARERTTRRNAIRFERVNWEMLTTLLIIDANILLSNDRSAPNGDNIRFNVKRHSINDNINCSTSNNNRSMISPNFTLIGIGPSGNNIVHDSFATYGQYCCRYRFRYCSTSSELLNVGMFDQLKLFIIPFWFIVKKIQSSKKNFNETSNQMILSDSYKFEANQLFPALNRFNFEFNNEQSIFGHRYR
ncbi:hypothetical protein BLOT_008170 [Blomia tropicalis]|nr:hypothetical protein BLOT_008170 [Blomia tropicalis]